MTEDYKKLSAVLILFYESLSYLHLFINVNIVQISQKLHPDHFRQECELREGFMSHVHVRLLKRGLTVVVLKQDGVIPLATLIFIIRKR